MPYLLDGNKSKVELSDAIKVTRIQFSERPLIEEFSTYQFDHELINETLFTQGYRPIGVAGFSVFDVDISVLTAYIISNHVILDVYNFWDEPRQLESTPAVYVLWIKST